MRHFRYYQEEASQAILLQTNQQDKCLVKMFCGTGKSLLMCQCPVNQDKNLVVYVFPSLSLILQFTHDYLADVPTDHLLNISSDTGSTTDPEQITAFLQGRGPKIICVTYQSYETLLGALGDIVIDVCWFDEAHHAVGETYQQLIFGGAAQSTKQIFLTATPKNANDIVMYDREGDPALNQCGALAYDYSYYRGVQEDYLNPFEIRIDFFLENTNRSLYETIARAILASGNGRVLTFHSDVNGDRDTSVLQFVDEVAFRAAFAAVLAAEFPDKAMPHNIHMVALTAAIPTKKRATLLKSFDKTPNHDIYVISSCETIGEGIDTKNANMCVFVDPKSSYVKIIQNIGRIVRKNKGIAKPNSTVLIPCWVDREKYVACEGDREKCDEVIRQDMAKEGNFNGILNVMSALRQEDEDIYDMCLNYPDVFSPQEIERHLRRHGFEVLDPVGEGDWMENIEYVIQKDLKDVLEDEDNELDWENYEDVEDAEEGFMQLAEDLDMTVEIHTNSLETPIETYNGECTSGRIVRLLRTEDEDTGETIYQPIVQRGDVVKKLGKCPPLDAKKRPKLSVHTNPDILVLWKLAEGADLTRDICSCVIDCEVVKYDPMEVAQGIVERALKRVEEGGELLPKNIYKKEKRITPELEQEYKDARHLDTWKQALKGKGKQKCPDKVRDYLDINLHNWRDDFDKKAMKNAIAIVDRAKKRENNGLNLLPKWITNKKLRNTSELEQEYRDATKLGTWKQVLKGKGGKSTCPTDVCKYLDINLPNWSEEVDLDKNAMENAIAIVQRAQKRVEDGGYLLPKNIRNKEILNLPEIIQERKDASKLCSWKQDIKGNKNGHKCPNEVLNYLDINLPSWREEQNWDKKAMEDAITIVQRAKEREQNGLNLLPRSITNKENRKTSEQEAKDANKLKKWKQVLKGKGGKSKCPTDVCKYLDINLPNWREEKDLDKNAMENAISIVERANQRFKNGLKLFPKCIKKEKRSTPELEQEYNDAKKLNSWYQALNGCKNSRCCNDVRKYLDNHLPNWREKHDEKTMQIVIAIVERAKLRQQNGLNLLPKFKENQTTHELEQEHKDAVHLGTWKQSLKGNGHSICNDKIRDYLDINLPNWRLEMDDKAIQFAYAIVKRAKLREQQGLNLLPKIIRNKKNRTTPELEQEHKDAQKLSNWKQGLKGNGNSKCPFEIIQYLDTHLPNWREKQDTEETTTPKSKPKPPKKSTKLALNKKSAKNPPEIRPTPKAEISTLHQRYKTLNSANLHQEFAQTPALWHQYHALAEKNESTFDPDCIPRNRVIQELDQIKTKRTKSVVDMGCGKAQIAQYFAADKRFHFANFDHVATHETIMQCDISRLPLVNDSVEICILSLAMWGSNCGDYLDESYRVLETGGILYIIEPTKRWTSVSVEVTDQEIVYGDRLKQWVQERGFQILREKTDKFCLLVCVK